MQEKNNKRRFILLVVLVVTTALVFWLLQGENGLDVDEEVFLLEDFSAINKIELAGDSGLITLSFNGTRWRVNNQYDADGDMIDVLFATLQQARPKRPVGSTRQDSIYRELMASGVKVSLFEGPELRKQFIAGGNLPKTQAYFADPSTGEVYIMAIPGYKVYVSGIFELNESGWRNKFVFHFNWRNFKSLEVQFPETPSENYSVAMKNDFFGVLGLTRTDTAKLNTFLDELSLLRVVEYIHKPVLRDSLQRVSPTIRFVVTDVGDRTYPLWLFVPENESNVWGIIQDSQLAVFDRSKIQPLMRSKSFFTRK